MNNPEPHLQESNTTVDDSVSHMNQAPQTQDLSCSEEEYDRYKDNPDLLGENKNAAGRLYAFDWANGFVSPFRPTPKGILASMLSHVHFFGTEGQDTLLDLGCGDGLVLFRALDAFPKAVLRRAIGVDLDRALLEQVATTVRTTEHTDRLEVYYGDFSMLSNPLTEVYTPANSTPTATVGHLIAESSHLFVYLLPEALSKLASLLLEAVENKKIVLSMRWEIPELAPYLVHGGPYEQFYIYQRSE
ncbi:hypothetical protein BGZ81_010983 [Podila clonocystis]|nr:hypothetical protein BGZ81_010983 [Podila clonocystis]